MSAAKSAINRTPPQGTKATEGSPAEPMESWSPVTKENAIFTGVSVAATALGSGLLYLCDSPLTAVAGAGLVVAGTLSTAVGIGALASGHSYKEIFSAIGDGLGEASESMNFKVRSDGTTSYDVGGVTFRSDGTRSVDLGDGMSYNSNGTIGFDLGDGMNYEPGKGITFEF